MMEIIKYIIHIVKLKGVRIMTVGTLIKYLEKYDKNEIVHLHQFDGEPVLFVLSAKNKDGVWLETESDNDMTEEIAARFETAIENGIDESDVYGLMLEQGIDVEMVRKYMDNEIADNMQAYCENHGLI